MSRIVIDARIIDTSTGVYCQRLLKYLHEQVSKDEYVVLVPSTGLDKWREALPNFRVEPADQPNYSFAEQLSLVRQLRGLKPDLVHFCMPQQPLLYFGRRVTTIHDTTLIRFDNIDMNPIAYKLRKFIFKRLVKNVARRSKAILVPTAFVRDDLADFCRGKYLDKIYVTYEAGDPVDAEPEAIDELQGKQFLLFVGNAFPYKNLGRIVEAFEELRYKYPELQLALAGKKDYFYGQLEKRVERDDIEGVHFLGFISDGQKRWAYQHASSYVTASMSEGFHVPLLEAMYENCPVVSSNASCLPEVAGDAATYFDPQSSEELVEALEKVLGDGMFRKRLQKLGQKRVKQFSWSKMAEQTRAVYRLVTSSK